MADAQVFEETFNVTEINDDKYDRVSRLKGRSTDKSIEFSLDINHELFPVQVGENINIVLATTLALDGSKPDTNETQWRNVGRQGHTTLADMYDYVCYGKNYRIEDDQEKGVLQYFASFGGLLLWMSGPPRKLTGLRIDAIYLLVKHA
ncbi:DNA-directed RNA polymerases I, II, and III subunit RPABC3 [Coniothyrium glycines]